MRQRVDDPPLVALLGRPDQTSMSRTRPLRRCVCLPANPSTNHLYGPRLSRQTQNVQTDRCLATKKPGKRLGPARRTLLMGRSGCRKSKVCLSPPVVKDCEEPRHCMHPPFRPWLRGEGRCSLLSLRRGRCLANRQTEGLQIRHMSRQRKSIFLRPPIKTCSASSGFLFAFGSPCHASRVPARSPGYVSDRGLVRMTSR